MAQVREKDYEIRDQQEAVALLTAQLQTTQGNLKEAEAANASVLETVNEMIAQDEHMLNELGKAQVGLAAREPAGVIMSVVSCASGSSAPGPYWLHSRPKPLHPAGAQQAG